MSGNSAWLWDPLAGFGQSSDPRNPQNIFSGGNDPLKKPAQPDEQPPVSMDQLPADWTPEGYDQENADLKPFYNASSDAQKTYGSYYNFLVHHYFRSGIAEGRKYYVEPKKTTAALPSFPAIQFPDFQYPQFPAYQMPTYPTAPEPPAAAAAPKPKANKNTKLSLLTGPQGTQPSTLGSSSTSKKKKLLG